jgi:hypothetical protein
MNPGAIKRPGKPGLTKATLRGKPLMKTTWLAKPGLTTMPLLGKPGLTKTALLGKPGLTTTAPPRDQAKAEPGMAISAIRAAVLIAFIAFSRQRNSGLAAAGMSFSILEFIISFGRRQDGLGLHDEAWFEHFARQTNSKSAQTPT